MGVGVFDPPVPGRGKTRDYMGDTCVGRPYVVHEPLRLPYLVARSVFLDSLEVWTRTAFCQPAVCVFLRLWGGVGAQDKESGPAG